MAERTASDVSTLLKTIRFSDHELSALWIRLGSIYEKTNKFDQALSAYMRCIEADGDNPVPLYRFVFICRAHRVSMLTHCLKLLGIHFLTFLTEYESTRQAAVEDWELQVERDDKREKEKQLLKNSSGLDGDKEGKEVVGRRDRDLTEEDMSSASSGIRALEDDPSLGPHFVLQNRGISIRRPIPKDRRVMGRKRGRNKEKVVPIDKDKDKDEDDVNVEKISSSKKQKKNDDGDDCGEKTHGGEENDREGESKCDAGEGVAGKEEEMEEEEEEEEMEEEEEEEESNDNENENGNGNGGGESALTSMNGDIITAEQGSSSSSSDLFTFPAPLAPMNDLSGPGVDHTAVHYGVGGWAGVDDDIGFDMIADIARENEEEEVREGRDKVEGHLQGPVTSHTDGLDSGEKIDGVEDGSHGAGEIIEGEEGRNEGVKGNDREGDGEGEGEGDGEGEGERGRGEGAKSFASSTLGTRKFPRHMIENELRAIAMWAVLLRESGEKKGLSFF